MEERELQQPFIEEPPQPVSILRPVEKEEL